jgi:hypothetical protein
MRVIGAADEFWRVRLKRIDATDDIDFEWHEDILYRTPNVTIERDLELWCVEALRVDDTDEPTIIASFGSRTDAEQFYRRVAEDLVDMTKTQFEEAYIVPAPSEDAEEM